LDLHSTKQPIWDCPVVLENKTLVEADPTSAHEQQASFRAFLVSF